MSPRAAWDRLSRRNRRALSVGALVVAAALAWTVGAAPWLSAVSERGDRLAAQRELLGAERDLLASDSVYRAATREGARRVRASAKRLLTGGSEGAAAASLEQLVRDRALARRVLVTATAPRAPEPAGAGLVSVGLEVRGESDLRGVVGLLASLEGGSPMLRVSRLRIRRAAGPTGRPGTLAFGAVVTGYLLSPGDGADAGKPLRSAAAGSRPGPGPTPLARGGRR